jgi:hypothetical protein
MTRPVLLHLPGLCLFHDPVFAYRSFCFLSRSRRQYSRSVDGALAARHSRSTVPAGIHAYCLMQTPEAKNIVMFQESLESKVQVPVDKSVDNIAAVPGQVEKAVEEQTTVQEIHEKI